MKNERKILELKGINVPNNVQSFDIISSRLMVMTILSDKGQLNDVS